MNDTEKVKKLSEFMKAQLDDHTLLSSTQSTTLLKKMQETIFDFDFGVQSSSPPCERVYEPELIITIKDFDANVNDLATWIHEGNPAFYDTASAKYIAYCLVTGEKFRPPYDQFNIDRLNPYCFINVLNEFGTPSSRTI